MKAWILDYLTFLIIKWVDSTTFNPYLLGSKKWKKAFDPKLCILYQKEVEDSKQGRLRKIDPESFKVFTEVCKTFVKSGDTPYHELQKTIKKKNLWQFAQRRLLLVFSAISERHANQLRSKTGNASNGNSSTEIKSPNLCISTQTVCVSRHETVFFD